MNRVLVTGGSGFIGRELVRHLTERQCRVRCLGRELLEHPSDPRRTDAWLAGCEAVVHLAGPAALRDNGRAAETRARCLRATVSLYARSRALGIPRFVFVSSAKVHGESGVFGPTDPPCPATAYARFKVEVESALRRRAERDPGSELVVLRLPVVYGAGVKGTFDRLLHSIECGMPIPISRRPSQRSFISRRNAASALAAALDVPAGTYLPSDQRDLDVESLIQGLARRLGVRPRLVRLPGFVCTVLWRLPRIGRPLRSLTSSFLIDGSLHDWQPPQAVGCGLDQLSSWWRALSVAAPVQSARQSSQPKVRGGSNSLYDATTRSRDALQR